MEVGKNCECSEIEKCNICCITRYVCNFCNEYSYIENQYLYLYTNILIGRKYYDLCEYCVNEPTKLYCNMSKEKNKEHIINNDNKCINCKLYINIEEIEEI